jgi:hypothetical protein
VQAKEGWSVELKSIATPNLGDSLRPIDKWVELPMGTVKALSTNVTRTYLPPKIGAVPGVYHGTACT